MPKLGFDPPTQKIVVKSFFLWSKVFFFQKKDNFLSKIRKRDILFVKIFPVCFVEGVGLTTFKKFSEYVICLILLGSVGLLYKNRKRFEFNIYWILLASLFCTIISEMAFTFYVSNYGFSNLVGHYFKLFSFYLIYKAIIEIGVQKPYKIIFKELDASNKKLNREIGSRIKSEKNREKVIKKLEAALAGSFKNRIVELAKKVLYSEFSAPFPL